MKKTVLSLFAALLLLVALSTVALAGDTSALRPPKGYKLAIVEFADLQCPDCARAEPLLEEASKAYKIPIVRYDFPLPKHNWSSDAHIFARWFDLKSKKIGDEYRSYIFKNQPQITPENLRTYTDKFAADHKLTLPVFVDPRGELAAKVRADFAIGQKVGIEHTRAIQLGPNGGPADSHVQKVPFAGGAQVSSVDGDHSIGRAVVLARIQLGASATTKLWAFKIVASTSWSSLLVNLSH